MSPTLAPRRTPVKPRAALDKTPGTLYCEGTSDVIWLCAYNPWVPNCRARPPVWTACRAGRESAPGPELRAQLSAGSRYPRGRGPGETGRWRRVRGVRRVVGEPAADAHRVVGAGS